MKQHIIKFTNPTDELDRACSARWGLFLTAETRETDDDPGIQSLWIDGRFVAYAQSGPSGRDALADHVRRRYPMSFGALKLQSSWLGEDYYERREVLL